MVPPSASSRSALLLGRVCWRLLVLASEDRSVTLLCWWGVSTSSSSWRLGGARLELLVGPSIVTGNTVPSVGSDEASASGAGWSVVVAVVTATVGAVSSASDGDSSEERLIKTFLCELTSWKFQVARIAKKIARALPSADWIINQTRS